VKQKQHHNFHILGIETSCDETSAAVLSVEKSGFKVLSNIVSSQIKLHARWGGVVPHLASREHVKNIDHVLNLALKESKKKMKDIDLIAITAGPGLIGSLMVGTMFAKTLAWKYSKPIIGVNHIEGHIYSNWLSTKMPNKRKLFPAICLVVSGGHTQLILMKDHSKYKLIGETLDDAAGEAFDKIARILGLGYPGGPVISRYAEKGNPNKFPLPRPMTKTKNYNFSFSGLKTAVLYLVKDLKKLSEQDKYDIAASAQEAIVDVLVSKTMRAAKEYEVKSIILSGGVSANNLLRETLKKESRNVNIPLFIPDLKYTTDNAAMITVAGYYNLKNEKTKNYSWNKIKADANWELV